MKKRMLKILLVALFMLALTACGQPQSFTSSEEGIIITADSSWSMPDKNEGLAKAYGSDEDNYQKMVECVLEQRGGKALLSVEKYDVTAYLTQQKNYIQWLSRQYSLLPEDEIDSWLQSQDQEDTALLNAYREAAINNDTSEETIKYIEILNEDSIWLGELSKISEYQLLDKEEAEILGQKTQILHYQYASGEDMIMEFVETSAIKDNTLYTVTIWGEQGKFTKKLADYKEILTSLVWADAADEQSAE